MAWNLPQILQQLGNIMTDIELVIKLHIAIVNIVKEKLVNTNSNKLKIGLSIDVRNTTIASGH